MGGIIMFISITIVSILGCFKYPKIIPILFITLGFGLVGFVDDFLKLVMKKTEGLKPSYKMLGLTLVSVVYVCYLVFGLDIGTDTYIPFIKTTIIFPTWLYIPFAVFVMLASTNCLNLTDGLDGLATGITAIIMTFFTVVGILLGVNEVSFIGTVITGACLGFLLFNLYPAKVIMGDTGSLALGGAFSAIALYLHIPFILVIVAGICVVEGISVILQVGSYKLRGKRIFKMAPIHHHLELSGWKETRIVWLFWIITFVLCAIGVLSIKG